MSGEIVYLFSGIGSPGFGIDNNEAAIATRRAARLPALHADVTALHPGDFPCSLLIATPPCQDYSTAGKGAGQGGDTGRLVREVLRWATIGRPDRIVCEQVRQVLPIWRDTATRLQRLGYFTAVHLIDCADYGVPQNRVRAVLRADRHGPVPSLTPTHAETPGMLSEAPWVTMATALGLPAGCFYDSGQNTTLGNGRTERYRRSCDRPAGTLTTKCVSQWVLHGAPRRKLTIADALTIQGFPADFPLRGNKTEQLRLIGNAVPPPVSAALTFGLLPVASP